MASSCTNTSVDSSSENSCGIISTLLSKLSDEKMEATIHSKGSQMESLKSTISKSNHCESGTHEVHHVLDAVERSTLDHVSSQLPKRIFCTKGCGVYGYFQVKNDFLKQYCSASLFAAPRSRQVEVFMRFSPWSGDEGGADTTRNVFGFSIRFFADGGNFDLVGSHLPVFYIRNPSLFPQLFQSMRRHPVTNLHDPSLMWSFFADHPETIHALLLLYSDRGLPYSYRRMNGYGCHAYKLINKQGQITYAKFSWRPAGQDYDTYLSAKDAAKIAAFNPDYYSRDLYSAIGMGDPTSWELYVQLMSLEEAGKVPFSPFDCTKVWPQHWFPRRLVGTITANRTPTSHAEDVEQVAFNPANLIPGICATPDPIFQTRMLVYSKAAMFRIGRNHTNLPVNQESEVCRMKSLDHSQYSLNSYTNADGVDEQDLESEFENAVKQSKKHDDEYHFEQARRFWNYILDREGRKRLCCNLASDLKDASDDVQTAMANILNKIEPHLSKGVSSELERWAPFKGSMGRPDDVSSVLSAYLHYGIDHMSRSTPNLSEAAKSGHLNGHRRNGNGNKNKFCKLQ